MSPSPFVDYTHLPLLVKELAQKLPNQAFQAISENIITHLAPLTRQMWTDRREAWKLLVDSLYV